MGIDPRKGLRPNLDLLSAYKIYEKDYPLFKPDISATLAMNSPLYKRIEEGLTEQSQLKAEHDADQARIRRYRQCTLRTIERNDDRFDTRDTATCTRYSSRLIDLEQRTRAG